MFVNRLCKVLSSNPLILKVLSASLPLSHLRVWLKCRLLVLAQTPRIKVLGLSFCISLSDFDMHMEA